MRKFEVSDSSVEIVSFHENGSATVHKLSLFTRKMHKITLPLTHAQFLAWYAEHKLIQDCMPHLTKEEREFFLTGSTPEEWTNAFGKPGEEDEED
jgi:hypothetical protein